MYDETDADAETAADADAVVDDVFILPEAKGVEMSGIRSSTKGGSAQC